MLQAIQDIVFFLCHLFAFALYKVRLSKSEPATSPDWIAHPLRHGKLLRDKNMSFADFVRVGVLHSSRKTNVFLCKHKGTNLYYALKGAKKLAIYRQEKRDFIVHEIKMHMSLNKFVPNLFRVFDNHSYVFFVMEYCVCADLETLAKRARWLPSEVLKYYTIQIVAALNYLHNARRMVYRNLEAPNVLIAANGQVKLTGFANAVVLGADDEVLTEDKPLRTKTDTLAPEMIPPSVYYAMFFDASERFHSIEVDFWALGVLLFKLVSGVAPHRTVKGIDAGTLWSNIATGERRRLPMYAKVLYKKTGFEEAIDGLLQVEMEKRWGSSELERCDWLRNTMLLDHSKLVPPYKPRSTLMAEDMSCFRKTKTQEAPALQGDEEFGYCYFQNIVDEAMLAAAVSSPKPKKKAAKPDILDIKPVQDPVTWVQETKAAVKRKKEEILERRKQYKVLPDELLAD